jgi:pimeloyl-ACP methyl ester carboxylesterase
VQSPSGRALLLPGADAPPAKVILVHGLGSRATCAPEDRARTRARNIAHAVQVDAWETTGQASVLDAADFITFSYGGSYVDCASGQAYPAASVPTAGAQAVYASRDTCVGLANAAGRLGQLVDGIVTQAPDTRVYLIGHSLGGMVGAYYLASGADGGGAVQSLVTLDSPLNGYQGLEVRLPCALDSPSRQDLRGDTPAVSTIAGLRDTHWVDRLVAINSTFIGGSVGPNVLALDCQTPRVQRDNWFTILFGDVLDAVSEWVEGHDCGFTHPDSLAAIARIINASPDVRVASAGQ